MVTVKCEGCGHKAQVDAATARMIEDTGMMVVCTACGIPGAKPASLEKK